MKLPKATNRRTVLKTIGAGVVGGTVLTGSAAGHGGDPPRVPVWFENQIWEMASRPPHGAEPTDDNSHAPIWHIAPGAADKNCAQIPGLLDFSSMEDGTTFANGAWGCTDSNSDGFCDTPGTGVFFDQTLSANPFSTLWHIHWVFDDDAATPYEPDDMVNEAVTTSGGSAEPLINGTRIRNAESLGNVDIVSIPFVFNCPIRPADDEHAAYCR